jgi:hypothetical protein
MTKVVSSYGPTQRVNILKKVKVDGAWNFYPAVVESNGKLKDKVRIKGAIEVHPEGTYYLEWREEKSRFREPVPDKADVLDWARRKFLELQAAKAGVLIAESQEQASPGIALADAATDYLEDIKPPQREKKTYTRGVTSWCRFRTRRAGRRSTSSLCATPWLAVRNGCAATRRPSANASSATVPCCCLCPRLASRPAIRRPCASVPFRWSAIAPTTTRFRLSSDTVRCWSRPMFIAS